MIDMEKWPTRPWPKKFEKVEVFQNLFEGVDAKMNLKSPELDLITSQNLKNFAADTSEIKSFKIV